MTKTQAKKLLERDYIPGGKSVKIEDFKNWRKTSESEVFRCGISTSYDIQSGPIYCGDIADYIAIEGNDCLCLCSRHTPKSIRESL